MGKVVGIIPARLESSRLPNKILIDICGLPMIIHTLSRAQMSAKLDDVYVATDSVEIAATVKAFGGKAIMTGNDHENGTTRCAEAVRNIEADYIVTIFGDEALLQPNHIDASIDGLLESDADVSILVLKYADFGVPTSIKVVMNAKKQLMYMSRSDIPSSARLVPEYMYKAYHLLSFRRNALEGYAALQKSHLESIEYVEHLRLLENGYKIQAVEVEYDCISVDDSKTLQIVRSKMEMDPLFNKYKHIRNLNKN